jgi:hypothetical protein
MDFDFGSVSLGFLIGAFTGAAGSYLADKYTDRRRDKEELRKSTKSWDQLRKRYADFISEIVADLNAEKYIRCFIVKPKGAMVGFLTEPVFDYSPEDHPLIMSAVEEFIERGMIKDITEGNLRRYRMSESFVELLMQK